MALPAPRQITFAGIAVSMSAPVASETVIPYDDLILHVKTTGTATNVTFTDPGNTPSGSVATNPVIAVGATAELFARVPATLVNSAGLIAVAFSGALTGVTAEWLVS
jgi:hypothetical protein